MSCRERSRKRDEVTRWVSVIFVRPNGLTVTRSSCVSTVIPPSDPRPKSSFSTFWSKTGTSIEVDVDNGLEIERPEVEGVDILVSESNLLKIREQAETL